MALQNETKARRKEISAKGARARWMRKATHQGDVIIMGKSLPCVVLDNGERVLTESAIFDAFDRPRRGSREQKTLTLTTPNFADANNLKPFITGSDLETLKPVKYLSLKGVESVGYPAEIIPVVCDLYLSARVSGALTPVQTKTAHTCEMLVRSLSKVGITALVDEATGYDQVRPRDALQKYLDKILCKELAEWSKMFPLEFYENIYKLKKWPWHGVKKQYYSCVGMYTNNLIYSRLGVGVLDELKKRTPKTEGGNLSNKYHQWFNTTTGSQMLGKHIHGIITLQRLALAQGFGWSRFMDMVEATNPIQEIPEEAEPGEVTS